MSTPKYVEIHALQTLPYSNPNRDDLGSPKTVQFGGAERTRISSQSWKRAIRRHVEDQMGDHAVRTRRVVKGVAERLLNRGWSQEEADAAGVQVAKSAGKGISLNEDSDDRDETVLTTSVLLFMPESGIDELADIAAEHREGIQAAMQKLKSKKLKDMKPTLPSKPIEEILKRRAGAVNLFGRMLAELPNANVDGAVQMAHAFTTHGTETEYDFFAAVDDIEQKLKLPGSGHIDTQQYSAGTFYRYANVNLPDLLGNLNEDTDYTLRMTRAFLDGFIHTVPSGKQTSTAAVTVPDLVHLVVRDDRPVSLASAFEAPIAGSEGYLAQSVQHLHTHAGALTTLLGAQHVLFAGYAATPQASNGNTGWDGFGNWYGSFEELVGSAVQACSGMTPS